MRSVLFSIGPLHIYSYGLMIAAGVIIALTLARRENNIVKLSSQDNISDAVFTVLLSGLAGSRLYYIFQHLDYYSANPFKIGAVWEGGLVFYGGMMLAVPALFICFRLKKILMIRGLDFLIPYAALAQAFGRVGCFMNGCCAGKVCDLPWAVSFPGGPIQVHPVQLYEAGYLLLVFAALRGSRSRLVRPGQTFAVYLILYGAGRFVIEFYRDGNQTWLFMTHNQWVSLASILVGMLILGILRMRAGAALRSDR